MKLKLLDNWRWMRHLSFLWRHQIIFIVLWNTHWSYIKVHDVANRKTNLLESSHLMELQINSLQFYNIYLTRQQISFRHLFDSYICFHVTWIQPYHATEKNVTTLNQNSKVIVVRSVTHYITRQTSVPRFISISHNTWIIY